MGGRRGGVEKHSCRWKLKKCLCQIEDLCTVCAELNSHSDRYLRDHGIKTIGVCLELYPASAPSSPPKHSSDTAQESVSPATLPMTPMTPTPTKPPAKKSKHSPTSAPSKHKSSILTALSNFSPRVRKTRNKNNVTVDQGMETISSPCFSPAKKRGKSNEGEEHVERRANNNEREDVPFDSCSPEELSFAQSFSPLRRRKQRTVKAPDRFVAEPANNPMMHHERVQPTRPRRAVMVESLKTAVSYFKKHPERRGKDVDAALIDGIVSADNTTKSHNREVFIPKGGTSKAAVHKRHNLMNTVVNGISRVLGANDPTSTKEEIGSIALEGRGPELRPIDVAGYYNEEESVENTSNGRNDATQSQEISEGDKERDKNLRSEVGTTLMEHVKSLKSPKARRPYLASYADYPKKCIERVFGISLSNREYNRIRKHAVFPGPFKESPEMQVFRCRIESRVLEALLEFLDSPTSVQKYAFGTLVREVLGGMGTVELASVDRNMKVSNLAAKFIVAICDDAHDEDLPNSQDRCQHVEQKTLRCCRCTKGHEGKHDFTPKGSISFNTAKAIIKELTNGDLKRLSGLDDVKVTKGRDNMNRLRRIADEHLDPEARHVMKKRVDEFELWLQSDFPHHLQRVGDHSCCCLTCGFNDENDPNDIQCPQRHSHKRPCKMCAEGFAIIEDLREAVLQRTNDPRMSQFQKDEIGEARWELDTAVQDLVEFRGHIARHVAEGDYDTSRMRNLPYDTSDTRSDYKMKILWTWFREQQNRFFGKRGTTCLGFMITYNKLPDCKEKEVKFVMAVSDDTLQDETQVICAKAYVYRNHMPEHINKVWYRSDGAGCFSSKLNRVVQPCWKAWTGIEEEETRLSPPGGGKDSLDGQFGVFGRAAETGVNTGQDMVCADDVLKCIEAAGGLTGTAVMRWKPDRTATKLSCHCRVSFESVLTTTLDLRQMTLRAHKHSGYGEGRLIQCSDMCLYETRDAPRLKKSYRGALSELDGAVQTSRCCIVTKLVLSFLDEPCEQILASLVLFRKGIPVFEPNYPELARIAPVCMDIRYANNHLQEIGAKTSKDADGTHKERVQNARKERAFKKAEKVRGTEEEIRREARLCGLYLCNEKCPLTGRYCRADFLDYNRLIVHMAKDKHDFPTGINAKDKMLLAASRPEGVLAVGSRPDRLSTKLHKNVEESAVGSRGADLAVCFRMFNRKEGQEVYHKPPTLFKEMCRLFEIGSDGKVPKLDAVGIHNELRKMIDPKDGGRMFHYGKRGQFVAKTSREYKDWAGCTVCHQKPCDCNGMCPPTWMCQNFINSRTQATKKKKAKKVYVNDVNVALNDNQGG